MTDYKRCDFCGCHTLKNLGDFWYFGWKIKLYSCQNCGFDQGEPKIKLIPSWLHFWLRDFWFGLRTRFFEIDCGIRYFFECVKSDGTCDTYQNFRNKYNSQGEILFWMQQTYCSFFQGHKH